jgi:bacteriophage N4 adsorption protein B
VTGLELLDAVAREVMLFAAVGLLIGGIDDLAVDLVFIVRRLLRRGRGRMSLMELPAPPAPGRLAVFVPAWDEARVIGAMLATAVDRLDHLDWRIYVGLYPNDPATVDAAAAIAERDDRVRLVIGAKSGPTTKADCLNTLWHALMRDDAAEGRTTRAVVLHDAEDVVHSDELRVFAAMLRDHDVVQLPVLPLIKSDSRLVSAHYADEFCEAHGKTMVVRTALGAGMPLAGTGCAIDTRLLAQVAAHRGGDPFDAASLVEDYELGLRLAELGARGRFARVQGRDGLVAVRSYFPGTLGSAIRQKARWMTGIAFAGWDRTGWAGRPLAIADHWMRARDRRAPLAVIVLAAAYLAALLLGVSIVAHEWTGADRPTPALPFGLLAANMALLAWRLAMRVACTARMYGPVEGLLAMPRFLVGNGVALAAAPRALVRYLRLLAGNAPVWDKTRHDFPVLAQPDA